MVPIRIKTFGEKAICGSVWVQGYRVQGLMGLRLPSAFETKLYSDIMNAFK